MNFPELPVGQALPSLLQSLASSPNAVLVAPPGAGKTTTVPLAISQAPWCAGQKILVLEPRRLAARMAATRMASLIGEQAGQTVGFSTRLERVVTDMTRIEVVTEGLLIRRLEHDPGLTGVACVIFDEIHERSLDGDLALSFCLDLQAELRPELRILTMSATLDGALLSGLLKAPVIESAGLLHPVAISQSTKDIPNIRDLPEVMARAIRAALAEHDGDILCFLPGMAEIRRTQSAVGNIGVPVLALHGDLPVADQELALTQIEGQRRVVLSTSIAETSLTVPGVRIVIDGGFRRSPVLDPATGLSRLTTLRVSRAAADQRAGRAGRLGPGVAIRLWSQTLHRGLSPFDRPEILDADLTGLVLACASWGARPEDLRFADPPPLGRLEAARALLRQLEGFDRDNRLTELGRRMAVLGSHPRLAAMMLAARSPGEAAMAADLAAILEERDPLRGCGSADILLRLQALEGRDSNADRGTIFRIQKSASQYRARLRTRAAADGDAGYVLASGFPDRIALNRGGDGGVFRLSGGGTARLAERDGLARVKLLVAAGLEQKDAARITLAAELNADDLPPAVADAISETVESGFDSVSGAVFSRRRRRLGALVLEDRMVAADPAQTAQILANVLCEQPEIWGECEEVAQFQARVAIMRGFLPGLPDISDAAIKSEDAGWLAPYLSGVSRLVDAQKIDFLGALKSRLEYSQLAALERDLPASVQLPGGQARVDYEQPVPQAEARAQAFFGLKTTPKLAGGRVALRLALLSPAGRPIAVTADLESFWRGGWADARRDMRGRYPKHDWPEDPGAAPHVPRPRANSSK